MNLISLMNEKIDDSIIVTCASTHLRAVWLFVRLV